jgi:hypothetical protein
MGVAKELAKRNNPDYSEENYTHVIPSIRNLTVQSQRMPKSKTSIAVNAAYSRAINDYIDNNR